MKTTLLLPVISLALLLNACNRSDGDNNNANLSRTELLKTGKWQMTSYMISSTVDGTPTTPVDQFAGRMACDKDNYTIFRADNHQILDEGASKCVAMTPQQQDLGTWLLIDNDTKFQATSGGGTGTTEIVQLDNNVFKTKFVGTPSVVGGKTVILTYESTLAHIN